MDKKQRFAVEAIIPKLLGEALYDVICYYLKKDIAEMRETIKVDSLVITDIETLIKVKAIAFQQMMETTQFRDMVLHSLSKIIKSKVDIIATLLVRYELAKGEQSTLMHDSLSKEFDKMVLSLKEFIKKKDYTPIYQKNQAKIQSVQ